MLYTKRHRNELNIVDVEKKNQILKVPVLLDESNHSCLIFLINIYRNYAPVGSTNWIDVCQSHANLLAAGDTDGNIKIYDKRVPRIARTIDNIGADNAYMLFLSFPLQ